MALRAGAVVSNPVVVGSISARFLEKVTIKHTGHSQSSSIRDERSTIRDPTVRVCIPPGEQSLNDGARFLLRRQRRASGHQLVHKPQEPPPTAHRARKQPPVHPSQIQQLRIQQDEGPFAGNANIIHYSAFGGVNEQVAADPKDDIDHYVERKVAAPVCHIQRKSPRTLFTLRGIKSRA